MRITNPQKSELKKVIKDNGLEETSFEYAGADETYQVKFKKDFFTFRITMIGPDLYQNRINYVNNKEFHSLKQKWQETIGQFTHWIKGIVDDVKYNPEAFSEADAKFPAGIKRYSKSFIEIYNQALVAETNGLGEICGLGYRKAFEFLIKDYLIKKHSKLEHDKIKKMLLRQCIDEYITSTEIKLLAHRASWLGNDHAHYIKKWKGKTLEDLKHLMDLTIKWILMTDELAKIHKSMPSGK